MREHSPTCICNFKKFPGFSSGLYTVKQRMEHKGREGIVLGREEGDLGQSGERKEGVERERGEGNRKAMVKKISGRLQDFQTW
jgi:hypothetical protein